MTHVGMDAEARRAAGISEGLLRVSIGLEAEKDLLSDLALSLAKIG
jgi:cystathionine gamma-synthase